jgi:hypothetical protein
MQHLLHLLLHNRHSVTWARSLLLRTVLLQQIPQHLLQQQQALRLQQQQLLQPLGLWTLSLQQHQ